MSLHNSQSENRVSGEEALKEQHARSGNPTKPENNSPPEDQNIEESTEQHVWSDPKTPVIDETMPDEGRDPDNRLPVPNQDFPASGEGEGTENSGSA